MTPAQVNAVAVRWRNRWFANTRFQQRCRSYRPEAGGGNRDRARLGRSEPRPRGSPERSISSTVSLLATPRRFGAGRTELRPGRACSPLHSTPKQINCIFPDKSDALKQ